MKTVTTALLLLLASLAPQSLLALREYTSGTSSRYAHCPLLDGVYTSVLRRIYKRGFHK